LAKFDISSNDAAETELLAEVLKNNSVVADLKISASAFVFMCVPSICFFNGDILRLKRPNKQPPLPETSEKSGGGGESNKNHIGAWGAL
jgi:hypothetical protein